MKKTVLIVICVMLAAQSAFSQTDEKRAARDAVFSAYLQKLRGSTIQVVDYTQLLKAAKGYKIVVLAGFSGLGYENPDALRDQIKRLVRNTGENSMYVVGGTADGIGAAYTWIPAIAAELKLGNIKTAGIVSRNAAQYGVEPENFIVFVDTSVDDWSVIEGGKSLMVSIAADTQGKIVYFGGGAVSKSECEEALARNVTVVIVDNSASAANKANAAKKLVSNPNYVVDGLAEIKNNPGKYTSLLIISSF
ncbi:MAG: hypothetical protein NT061_07275 [Spirochaetes bacterium]|nr:hypothetical protein [Spirochaetota bacterium]